MDEYFTKREDLVSYEKSLGRTWNYIRSQYSDGMYHKKWGERNKPIRCIYSAKRKCINSKNRTIHILRRI